jgi:pilus assembly protein Flp/PilA
MLLDSVISAVTTRILKDDEQGQGLAEYALILALIAVISIIAMMYLGGQISQRLSQVGNAV